MASGINLLIESVIIIFVIVVMIVVMIIGEIMLSRINYVSILLRIFVSLEIFVYRIAVRLDFVVV